MAVQMQITPGTLPEGYCPSSMQNLLNTVAANLSVTFPLNSTFINYGPNLPAVDQQIFPWYRTYSDGTPDGLYTFVGGLWLRPNPVPPNSAVSYFYKDTLTALLSYDGGDGTATTPTSTTGAMWTVDTTMQGVFPLGVSADGSTYALNSTGGEAQHLLVINEIPSHSHTMTTGHADRGDTSQPTFRPSTGGGDSVGTGNDGSTGGSLPHNNMPPYIAGYWIKRTARQFYTVSA